MRFSLATVAVITAAAVAAFPSNNDGTINFRISARDVQLEQTANAILSNMSIGLEPGEFTIACSPPGWEGVTASCLRLREGVSYLRGKHKMCGAAAGIQQRVSCSWGAGIFLHNTVDYYQEMPCPEVGDMAEKVLQECGGSLCMTDTRKPGKCITGFLATASYGVVVALQNC